MTDNPWSTVDGSEACFGYIDTSRFYGTLEWHPVLGREFWSLLVDDILVDGKSLGLFNDQKYTMTPDTGTTYMTMPTKLL